MISESMGYLLSAASNPTGKAALEQMSLEIREERVSHTRNTRQLKRIEMRERPKREHPRKRQTRTAKSL